MRFLPGIKNPLTWEIRYTTSAVPSDSTHLIENTSKHWFQEEVMV